MQVLAASTAFRWLLLIPLLAGLYFSAAQSGRQTASFDIQISLSSKAASKLASLSEGIVVSATWSGNPRSGAERLANQAGQIDLGRQTIELSGRPQTAHITAPHPAQGLLGEIQGPVELNVNVYSARRSGPDNILNCDFYDGNQQDVLHKPLAVHCSLITEKTQNSYKNGLEPIPADRLADSYAIYAMLLPGGSADTISPSHIHDWSLADTTVSITDMNPAVPPDGQLKAPPENVKGFNEALQDFQARRYQRFQLDSADFRSQAPPLISQQQVSDLRSANSGQSGVAFFSAVYFNDTQTAALVYVNAWCANLCAAGQWVYLEKHGNEWVRRSGIVRGGA
jgi:hypothetical protein